MIAFQKERQYVLNARKRIGEQVQKNKDKTMRPDEHYHIKELIDRQEVRTNDINHHRAVEKERAERDSLIADAKQVDRKEFHCRACNDDFIGVTQLQVEEDWHGLDQRIAFYKTKCFKGHWCIRLVTDRNRDPYWRLSKAVRADRAAHTSDLLQPFEEGYNLLYGKK